MKNKNSGDRNSGYHNSGDCNSGYHNSGHYNSGDCNSGHYNSGYRNSGDRNSGYHNSGHYNSGDCNSGHYNSGDCNSGDYNSGFFNTNEPNVRLFNKDTNLKRSEINIPYLNLKITEWIDESKMTSEQKANDKDFHIKGGTLINRTYKEAWKLAWSEISNNDKDIFKSLPNFCPEIFKEITGVVISTTKKITIDGKDIEISTESFEELKQSLLK